MTSVFHGFLKEKKKGLDVEKNQWIFTERAFTVISRLVRFYRGR